MLTKPRIVFMGSPDFALPAMLALHGEYPLIGVVTQPDRAAGRGRELKPPPVKSLAIELGIPVVQPEKLHQPGAVDQLRAWAPDVIVVAAYGQILREEVLDLPEFGCINVHASLLPRWRGAAPIHAAILHGDERTGVTIMKMDEGLDTGPIISQFATTIQPDETAGSLFDKLAVLGAEHLLDVLPGYLSGKIRPVTQPRDGVTYAPTLRKEEARLDFSQPAVDLERKVRAFSPWPGAHFEWDGNLLKVHRAGTSPGEGRAGERVIVNGMPAVVTSAGFLLLEEVQPAGKKSMPGKAFLAGARNWVERH